MVTPNPASLAIEQLAAVIAAQGDDFALDEILALEGVSAGSWASAKRHWLPKLAVDETLRAQYDGSLAEAQDRLDREVSPVASELDAWVAFLVQCETDSAEQVAERHDLTLNDFARLQRKWQQRFEADDELAEQARKLREAATAEAGPDSAIKLTISARARPLQPSPYAPNPAAANDARPATSEWATTPLSLEILAAILIECSLDIGLSDSYQSHGFASAAQAQATLISWQLQLEADLEAQDALQDILDRRRVPAADVVAPASAAALPDSGPSTEHLRSPWQRGGAVAAVALPPLPFDATGAFQPLSLMDEDVATDSAPTPAWQPHEALPFAVNPTREGAASSLDETSGLDAQLLAIDALPFDTAASVTAAPSPDSSGMDSTGFVDTNLLNLDELPFDDAPSPAARFRAAPAAQQQVPQPHQAKPGEVRPELRSQDTTRAVDALSLSQLARPPLPFATAAQTSAVVPQRRAKARTFVGRLPTLTVDQYACYIAERDGYPDHLAHVMHRYGVPSEGGHGVMALRWAARLAAHPAQQQRYSEAYQQYYDWLESQRGG